MIAILLYVIGFISAVATAVLVGFDVPNIYPAIVAAAGTGIETLLPALARAVVRLNWALYPFLGGLLLMGFARIIILLGSINRGLRGHA